MRLCTAGAVLAVMPGVLHAQSTGDFPSRPIRFLIHLTAGAGADISARAVGQKLGEALGQQVVADNRPGASGNITLELLSKSPANGYTIALVTATQAINRALTKSLPYDLLKDFVGVSQITSQPYCLAVNPNIPAKTVKELLDLARAKPGTLTYGSAGNGSLSHLAGAMVAHMGRIEWTHVPYKGGMGGINDTIAGQISSQFTTIIGTWQHVKNGRLRWLAVSTITRSKVVPDLPTVSEAGLTGFDVNGWYGIVTHAQTPKPIVDRLSREVAKVLQMPDVGGRFALDGSEAVSSTPAEFTAHIRREADKYAVLTKQIGMRIE